MFEAQRAGDLLDLSLVRRIAVAVHQADRERIGSGGSDGGQFPSDVGRIERTQHGSLRIDPFAQFDDVLVQRGGFANMEIKQSRPRLISDRQHVAEPGGCDERDGRALVFQQGVRAACGAESHVDVAEIFIQSLAQQPPNTGQWGLFRPAEFVVHSGGGY